MKKSVHRLATGVKRLPKHLQTRRVIARFVDSIGWVYFGRVNQHDDEHIPVRGFTVSVKHQDAHYSSGMLSDYSAILVQRTDSISMPGKPSLEYRWVILKFTLKTRHHPHLFVTPIAHPPLFYEYFFTKQYHFRQVDITSWAAYEPAFTSRFAMFTSRGRVHDAPALISPAFARALAKNLSDFEFEIQDNELYIYSTSLQVSTEMLEKFVTRGLWLAQQLDSE